MVCLLYCPRILAKVKASRIDTRQILACIHTYVHVRMTKTGKSTKKCLTHVVVKSAKVEVFFDLLQCTYLLQLEIRSVETLSHGITPHCPQKLILP